jgi:hypothetical protein
MKLRTVGIFVNYFGLLLGVIGVITARTASQQVTPLTVVFVNAFLIWLWLVKKD